MARKNIPLTIVRPSVQELHKITFVANADGQENTIPYRYPFADIENVAALRTAGFFRHALTSGVAVVSTELGGSAVADEASNLGFQLPYTEKLILLCRVNTALTTDKKITITVKGSTKYSIPDKVYVITEDLTVDTTADLQVVANDEFEIDLYNFGLLINAAGEVVITADGNAAANADDGKISFALVARMA